MPIKLSDPLISLLCIIMYTLFSLHEYLHTVLILIYGTAKKIILVTVPRQLEVLKIIFLHIGINYM